MVAVIRLKLLAAAMQLGRYVRVEWNPCPMLPFA